jgi:hypothetical protein
MGALFASSAQASGRPSLHVSVVLRGCDPSTESEVRRIAALELRAVVVAPTNLEEAVTRAEVVCQDDTASLRVSDEVTSKRLERTVSLLAAGPAGRARLIALAVAELVDASWEEAESNPDPRVPPLPASRPEARSAVRRALRARPAAMIDADGEARWLAASRTWLAGGGGRVTLPLVDALVVRLDATAETGQVSRSLGDVAVEMFGGSASLGWMLDASWVSVLPWIGVGAGYARLVGLPGPGAIGRVQQGAWGGPEGGVELALWPHESVHATLGWVAGGALLGVRGDVAGEQEADVLGLWTAVTIGVGFSKR